MFFMPMTPSERTLRARLGAHTLHATHDPRETTAKAREALQKRFEDEVDPDRVLPEDERARRIHHAKQAYYARLALKSAQSRRARRAAAE